MNARDTREQKIPAAADNHASAAPPAGRTLRGVNWRHPFLCSESLENSDHYPGEGKSDRAQYPTPNDHKRPLPKPKFANR